MAQPFMHSKRSSPPVDRSIDIDAATTVTMATTLSIPVDELNTGKEIKKARNFACLCF